MCSSQKRAKPVCFPILWQRLLQSLQRNSHRDRVTSVVWRSLPAILWDSVEHTRLEFNGWVYSYFRCYALYCAVFIPVQANENCHVGTISETLKISKSCKRAKDVRKTLSVWESGTNKVSQHDCSATEFLNLINWRFLITILITLTFWRLCIRTFTLN